MYKRDLQFLFDDCLLHCSIDEAALHRVFDRLLLDETFRAGYGYDSSQLFRAELIDMIERARRQLGYAIGKDGAAKKRLTAGDRASIADAYAALGELNE